MSSIDWHGPLILEQVRASFEASPSLINSVPGNLCIIGIVSGHRILSRTSDFTEIQFDVSQGYNDEIRFIYKGERNKIVY